MDKEQLDSLPTVTVGSEKIPPPPHSHYAPSEVYSSSESPPAYSRPTMKSSAVQIARIIAMTLITISVIIGSFMLASAWLQVRASCTPESITQPQINTQPEELFKHLQPEALVQDAVENKDNLQNSETDSVSIKKIPLDSKNSKVDKDNKDNLKVTNNNGNDNDNDDDYNDLDFSGVHIKFPLQLDLDDLANTLMRQSRGLVSCVVERRRTDEYSDERNVQLDNNNRPHDQRLSGERVVILCESGEPKRQDQQQQPQQQEMLTPIIVPLGNVPIPMRPQEQEYHRYQVQNQFPMPDVHHPSLINAQRMSPLDIQNNFLPEIRNIHQIIEMDSSRGLPSVNHPQMELRPIPIELRPVSVEMIQGMRPPSNQMEQQNSPMSYQDTPKSAYPQDQQTQGIVSPPLSVASNMQENLNAKMGPQVMIHQQFKQKPLPIQESQEKPDFAFPGLPIDILKIIKQVPLKIQSIMQRIDEGLRSEQAVSGLRQEQIQDFKPFPMDIRPIPMNPANLPVEVKNLLEHGNIDGLQQNNFQLPPVRPISIIEKVGEKSEEEKKMALPEKNLLQRIFENQEAPMMPKSQITMSFIRPIESFEIPIGVNTHVIDASMEQEEKEPIQAEQSPNQEMQTDKSDEANRPHYVQPRSVDSNYPSVHLRQEKIR
ncbi:putative mediator of RNA polymerase II transcription subunit 26 [Chelonus insularis]|uniref:putative mediator of RNA polymerase II transcription subunit 26 n=1 Tax=Chelonus insularis TaxID=460826 RepID=UPI00158D2E64|nr:putative mediator of RNA polymerase II transcription subunit 26 [Chelonus insularis]